MEPEHHPFEQETYLSESPYFGVQNVIFFFWGVTLACPVNVSSTRQKLSHVNKVFWRYVEKHMEKK